jgi:hypothetical protein
MPYRCVATSVAGFVQQLAVAYLTKGYYFYVTGRIPARKDPLKTDQKILEQYDIAISKWARARREQEGRANLHYLRYERFYVIIASHGVHPFFAAEAKRLRDIRRTPISFQGYSIGCRRARGGGVYHASVRICQRRYSELKARFKDVAVHRTVEELYGDFRLLPFEPYAPVRSQRCCLHRAVNRRRQVAGLDVVPREALRLHRAPVRPFGEQNNPPGTNVRSEPSCTTEIGD